MELPSPPKPTRIVDYLMPNAVEEQISQRTEQTTSSNDFLEQNGEESSSPKEMVSLPALTGEVVVAQKQQINDLSKKLEILDQLKVKDVYRTSTVNFLSLECSFVLAFVNFRFNNASITTFFSFLRVWTVRKNKTEVCILKVCTFNLLENSSS